MMRTAWLWVIQTGDKSTGMLIVLVMYKVLMLQPRACAHGWGNTSLNSTMSGPLHLISHRLHALCLSIRMPWVWLSWRRGSTMRWGSVVTTGLRPALL